MRNRYFQCGCIVRSIRDDYCLEPGAAVKSKAGNAQALSSQAREWGWKRETVVEEEDNQIRHGSVQP